MGRIRPTAVAPITPHLSPSPPTAATRIGLLGGTFDPPHIGHLWLAETAREQLQLDQVLFLPVGQPPHKTGKNITAVAHRAAMLQLATQNHPTFAVDYSDINRPPPHTTVTLLPSLQAAHPQARFWLLMGGDSLRDLPTWAQPQQLIANCRLGVLPRPGAAIDWAALETAVPGVQAATDYLPGPTVAISATEIRQWAMAGHSLRYLVTTAVYQYIETEQLYGRGP